MSSYQSLLVLLGQGDGEGWMQILVFVVLAVIWAIGGIMKARAEKANQQKQQPQQPVRQRPRGRPGFDKLFQTEQPEPKPRRPLVKPQPVVDSILSLKAKTAAPRVDVKKKVPVQAVQAIEKKTQPLPDLRFTMEDAFAESQASLATLPQAELRLSEPEQLRAAIIHYEIFGKCIAQRQPTDQIW